MDGLEYLLKGGPIMYILLPMSALAITVIIERYVYLRKEREGVLRILDVLWKSTKRETKPNEIRRVLEESQKGHLIVGKILSPFLDHKLSGDDLEHMVAARALFEEKRLKERMWFLDTTVTMAPLLGLLGTIMGIIRSFHVMSISGLGKPAQITGGVAEALIATATGLVIAILSLGIFNLLNTMIREIRNSIESASRLLFSLRDHLEEVPEMTAAPSVAKENKGAVPGEPAYQMR